MAEVTVEQAFDLALQHYQTGRLQEAESVCRQILAVRPGHFDSLHLLGLIAHQVGRNDVAVDLIAQAISIDPRFPPAYVNLGSILRIMGRMKEAIAAFRQALTLNPNLAEAHFHLGNGLRESGAVDQAIAAYRRAIEIDANLPEVYVNLGIALGEKGQFAEAIGTGRQAIALRPDYPEAHGNLGNALFSIGQLDEAIAAYQRAIALRPDYADALGNLGNALKDRGQLDEAITVYHQAIQLKPNFSGAYSNLGNALKDKGQLDEAFAAYRQAMAVNPNLAEAHSNLLFALQYHPEYDNQSLAEEHRVWNARHAQPLRQAAQDASAGIQSHGNDRSPNRRLRIGYVSPDFRDHCQALFTVGLISHHDIEQFEIFCYSSVHRPDHISRWIAGCADCWRQVTGMSDAELAGVIRADKIDILVDLTMHMADARPLLFARKPAPVQVTWLAYPGTTGLSAMDYRLTDPYLDPPGENDQYYSEQSIRLPETFWCYNPLTVEPAVNGAPALERGYLTFGCLNNFCKVNEETISLWAQVMRRVENSRLLLMAPLGAIRPSVLERFARHGIAAGRIEFVSYQPRQQYLETYHRIDIGLDTFPYNGHTTSLDSLWMGVPVVTRIGTRAVARAGWCQLSNLGLGELAGGNSEEFVRIAADLANDLPRLVQLRGSLRRRMEQSPLMDAPRFARNMEAAYRRMWQAWCRTAGAVEGGGLETIPLSG